MKPFIADPKAQQDIATLAEALHNLSVNTTLTYEEAWRLIGRESRYALLRARQEVEKADGIRFGCERKRGIVKMSAESVPGIGTAGVRGLYRKARQLKQRLSGLKYNDLNHEDRLLIAGARLVASHVEEQTARAAVKEATDTVRTAGADLNIGRVNVD